MDNVEESAGSFLPESSMSALNNSLGRSQVFLLRFNILSNHETK